MQFIGQSLPAHHFFYSRVRIFTLSHIVSQAVFYNTIIFKLFVLYITHYFSRFFGLKFRSAHYTRELCT